MLKSIVQSWKGAGALDVALREPSVELQGDSLCLLRRVVLADELGNCNVRDTQPIDGWTWARKDFVLDDPRAEACRVTACAQVAGRGPAGFGDAKADDAPASLVIEVNGHAQSVPYLNPASRSEGDPHDPYWQVNWPTVDVPAEWLRQGVNTVILRTEDGSRWESFIEVSRFPNRSACSADRGQTWDYDHLGHNACYDGEFLVRMELVRYASEGKVVSPVCDLSMVGDGGGLGQVTSLRKLSLDWQAEIPADTELGAELRVGSTPSYDPRFLDTLATC